MKKFLVLMLLLATMPAFAAEDSAYDRVMAKNEVVCGIIPWPPYKFVDPNTKEWKGFALDIYRKAFATLDMKVIFKEVVLGNQVQDLNSGRVDALCDEGPWTMSAGKFVEYSSPIYVTTVYPFVRVTEKKIKTRTDLNNKDVHFTSIDGDKSGDLVRRLFPKASLSTMPSATDNSQLFLNVVTGKADVVVADPSAFAAFDKSNPGKLKPMFKDEPLGKYKILIAVKKGDFKMLGLVNQAVDNALAFGIVDEVLDGFDPKHENLMRVRLPYSFQ